MPDSFVTPWTVAHKAPLSMGFSRHESWSGVSFPPPGGLPDPGIGPESPALAGRFFTTVPPGKPQVNLGYTLKGELTALPDGLGMGCEENVRIIPYPCVLSI